MVIEAKGHYCSLDTVSKHVLRALLLKTVHIPMLMNEGDGVISQDVITVVYHIDSATANTECCSVMITDPASHHNTPSLYPSIIGNELHQRIVHNAMCDL